jgi:2-polyprenyl-3-methyl-5-hydroxy-6-metoxy-1,4-benzoquinol methylase
MFRVVRCDDCGLVFVNPRLQAEDNERLYAEEYFRGDGFDHSMNYEHLSEEREQKRREGAGMIAKIRVLRPERDLRVLDVGCGTGEFLAALLDAGYTRVKGVECSRYAAELAQNSTGVPVLISDLLDAKFADGERFDVITAIEVIEHVRDPMRFFDRIRELLAPGGIFVYTTGNERGIYAQVLGKRWPYYIPEGHLFYFNPRTISEYFAKTGLRAVGWRTLGRRQREAFLQAEDAISQAQLSYVGLSDRGYKGKLFRAVAAVSVGSIRRLVTKVVGKHDLPVGMRPD